MSKNFTRSDYSVWRIADSQGTTTVFVEDLDRGSRSVTNDIANGDLIDELVAANWLAPGSRLFYRDSMGQWGEVRPMGPGQWRGGGNGFVHVTTYSSDQLRAELEADRAATRALRQRERRAAADRAKYEASKNGGDDE